MANQTQPAAAPAPAPATIKIKALVSTACETVEGQCLDLKKDDLVEVPTRAGEYLIRNKRADLVP